MLLIAKNCSRSALEGSPKMCVCFFNEIYSCLPQNDKLRNVKFFEGPFLCVTAHRETKL